MVSLRRKTQISRVNARHLLDDLSSSYTYSIEDAVLVEIIANALDAKSSEISIDLQPDGATLTILDNGSGMGPEQFDAYHDLAQSGKVRGEGIGFAGLGAKLAHLITSKMVTETRSGEHRAASEWRWRGEDLVWKHIRKKSLPKDGTKITLPLRPEIKKNITLEFVERIVHTHFGAILDPLISQEFIWNLIYPIGVAIYLNGRRLGPSMVASNFPEENREQMLVPGKGRERLGSAVFVLAKEPLPVDQQGITISTYGKTIRTDFWGLYPRQPERITGWFECPELVRALTLDKQDFQMHGQSGETFRRVRREFQKVFGDWLKRVGATMPPEEKQRAPRQLERETARILKLVPELRNVYRAKVEEIVNAMSNSNGNEPFGDAMVQLLRGMGLGDDGSNTIESFIGDQAGLGLSDSSPKKRKATRRRRTIQSGPRIERVSAPDRPQISWLEGDTLSINTAHPLYVSSERRRFTPYHERFAIFYALSIEATVEPEHKLELLAQAMTVWGRM